jgi:uncharacterized BrkB/YihY/UPF0761 family membrane protein
LGVPTSLEALLALAMGTLLTTALSEPCFACTASLIILMLWFYLKVA